MTHQRRVLAGVLATASAALAALVQVHGSAAPPRTREGHPDLQGIWSYATLTPLERPAEFSGKAFLTDAEAAAFERKTLDVQNRDRRDGDGPGGRGTDGRTDLDRAYNQVWWEYGAKVVGSRRTSLIIDPPDGQIPPLTAEGRKSAEDKRGLWTANGEYEGGARGLGFDSYLDRPLQERCLGWTVTGPPMLPGAYNNNMQVFQTPDAVAILNEMVHEHRIVPLDGRPQLESPLTLWMGSSRGRWDGDTLLVDTTNFKPTVFRGASGALHLVERFRRADADTLLYEFTVDDPVTWTRPWTVQFPMSRSREPIFEYACHEGNYSLVNILAGARAAEKAEKTAPR
jgi:hypothetical protein